MTSRCDLSCGLPCTTRPKLTATRRSTRASVQMLHTVCVKKVTCSMSSDAACGCAATRSAAPCSLGGAATRCGPWPSVAKWGPGTGAASTAAVCRARARRCTLPSLRCCRAADAVDSFGGACAVTDSLHEVICAMACSSDSGRVCEHAFRSAMGLVAASAFKQPLIILGDRSLC
jgi:hypothetical protein